MSSQLSTGSSCSSVDGLPKQFIQVLRTLFNILDDKSSGLVKFSDIEARWQDDGTKGLPKGVIDSLRKVTPANGLLSFERFCAGLKICLLRNQMELKKEKENIPLSRPPSAPTVTDSKISRPNQQQFQQRAFSMSHLAADKNPCDSETQPIILSNLRAPPKPPRSIHSTALAMKPVEDNREEMSILSKDKKTEIRAVLQNWKANQLANAKGPGVKMRNSSGSGEVVQRNFSPIPDFSSGPNDHNVFSMADCCNYPHQGYVLPKKTSSRRREPRRHTLQNGVDYNMFRKMKQMEDEKRTLLEGLSMVEQAREWYIKYLNIVHDKMKYLGRPLVAAYPCEQWTEREQERIELQRARIMEVNRHLAMLVSFGGCDGGAINPLVGVNEEKFSSFQWGRRYPLQHMNLALTTRPLNYEEIQRKEVEKEGKPMNVVAASVRQFCPTVDRRNLPSGLEEQRPPPIPSKSAKANYL